MKVTPSEQLPRTPLSFGLIIGFPALIILILISGLISSQLVGSLRAQVVDDLEREHIARLDALLDLRESISSIYIKARERPVERLKDPSLSQFTALPKETEQQISRDLAVLRATSISKTKEWQKFEQVFQNFLYEAINPVASGINGFNNQRDAAESLVPIFDQVRAQRANIYISAGSNLQQEAQHNILVTTFISLMLGLTVSTISLREIINRFRDLQTSYRALDAARLFTRKIIDSNVNAILTLDANNNLTDANPAFYQLLGINSSYIDQPLTKVLEQEPALLKSFTETQAFSERYRGRITIGQLEPRRIDIYVSPLFINDTRSGTIGLLIDVTEVERAQQENLRNQALAAIGQLTTQVAHEIKNPLGGIKLNITYLQRIVQRNDDNQEIHEILEEFSAAIERLSKIVMEMNQFARPRELNRSPFDVHQLIDEQLAFVADKVKNKNIDIKKNYQPELPFVRIDHIELAKAMINIIINAIDASPASAPLFISTKHKNTEVEITIQDQGSGMSKETLSRLFEPFFTTKGQGTGLGMSITKRAIELHGGKLAIKSKEGEGTTVVVTLPIN